MSKGDAPASKEEDTSKEVDKSNDRSEDGQSERNISESLLTERNTNDFVRNRQDDSAMKSRDMQENGTLGNLSLITSDSKNPFQKNNDTLAYLPKLELLQGFGKEGAHKDAKIGAVNADASKGEDKTERKIEGNIDAKAGAKEGNEQGKAEVKAELVGDGKTESKGEGKQKPEHKPEQQTEEKKSQQKDDHPQKLEHQDPEHAKSGQQKVEPQNPEEKKSEHAKSEQHKSTERVEEGKNPSATDGVKIELSPEQKEAIGKRVWQNEAGGSVDKLTHWNKGEAFPSLGIGHFIWQPEGKTSIYGDSFKAFVKKMEDQKNPDLPKWLNSEMGSPWKTKAEFDANFNSPKMKELREFLVKTIPQQTDHLISRLEESKTKILDAAAPDKKDQISKNFDKVLKSGPEGVFAMVDYVNFKGEGLSMQPSYKNTNWGLRQVLENMKDTGNPVKDFSASARQTLQNRVENAPPEKRAQERQWMHGWGKRVDDYQKPFDIPSKTEQKPAGQDADKPSNPDKQTPTDKPAVPEKQTPTDKPAAPDKQTDKPSNPTDQTKPGGELPHKPGADPYDKHQGPPKAPQTDGKPELEQKPAQKPATDKPEADSQSQQKPETEAKPESQKPSPQGDAEKPNFELPKSVEDKAHPKRGQGYYQPMKAAMKELLGRNLTENETKALISGAKGLRKEQGQSVNSLKQTDMLLPKNAEEAKKFIDNIGNKSFGRQGLNNDGIEKLKGEIANKFKMNEPAKDKPEGGKEPSKEVPKPEQKDPANDKPQQDPAKDKPQQDPAKDKPQQDPGKDKPQQDPAKDTPQQDPAKDKPQQDPAKDTPQQDPAKDKPQQDPAKDTPQQDPAKDKPQQDPAKDKPQQDPAKDKPQQDPAKDKPQQDPAKDKPQQDPAKDKPQQDPARDKPQDPGKDKPQQDPAKDTPQQDPAKDKPQQDPAKDKPEPGNPKEPGKDLPKEAPKEAPKPVEDHRHDHGASCPDCGKGAAAGLQPGELKDNLKILKLADNSDKHKVVTGAKVLSTTTLKEPANTPKDMPVAVVPGMAPGTMGVLTRIGADGQEKRVPFIAGQLRNGRGTKDDIGINAAAAKELGIDPTDKGARFRIDAVALNEKPKAKDVEGIKKEITDRIKDVASQRDVLEKANESNVGRTITDKAYIPKPDDNVGYRRTDRPESELAKIREDMQKDSDKYRELSDKLKPGSPEANKVIQDTLKQAESDKAGLERQKQQMARIEAALRKGTPASELPESLLKDLPADLQRDLHLARYNRNAYQKNVEAQSDFAYNPFGLHTAKLQENAQKAENYFKAQEARALEKARSYGALSEDKKVLQDRIIHDAKHPRAQELLRHRFEMKSVAAALMSTNPDLVGSKNGKGALDGKRIALNAGHDPYHGSPSPGFGAYDWSKTPQNPKGMSEYDFNRQNNNILAEMVEYAGGVPIHVNQEELYKTNPSAQSMTGLAAALKDTNADVIISNHMDDFANISPGTLTLVTEKSRKLGALVNNGKGEMGVVPAKALRQQGRGVQAAVNKENMILNEVLTTAPADRARNLNPYEIGKLQLGTLVGMERYLNPRSNAQLAREQQRDSKNGTWESFWNQNNNKSRHQYHSLAYPDIYR
ncbi:MAG: N-acetylmuramoyl-L-alanine amidase [Candidatus Obscuribacterales bacterium]|jgi:hypothetical protein|nr:N-acetylmuramoyl-L-alanine amidase [Candidatus Obscuribacterales bacterium]